MIRRIRTLALLVAALVATLLVYGPLFAWSPVAPGFVTRRVGEKRVRFRASSGAPDVAALAGRLAALEQDVGLSYRDPVTVVLCDTWADLTRFVPWHRVSHGVEALTLPIGLVVYVTPTIRNRGDLSDVVAHEAAHVLLYQRAAIRARLEMERQAWFVEGVGAHFGNPAAYESPEEFRRAMRAQDVAVAIDPGAAGHVRRLGTFAYSAYRYVVAHLVARDGAARFHRFVQAYVRDPSAHRDAFAGAFGAFFQGEVAAFANGEAPEPSAAGPIP